MFAPGSTYSGCMSGDECLSNWCLQPADEPGFCTEPCGAGGPPCEQPDLGTATAGCVTLQTDAVCALDCSDDRSCPAGMRCEQVEVDRTARSLCF